MDRKRDERTDARIREDFEQLCRKSVYKKLLAVRQKLPSFASKEQFLELLESHQCIVVVGETGMRIALRRDTVIPDTICRMWQDNAA